MGSGRDALPAARQLASRIEPTHNPAMAATPPTRILLGRHGRIAAYKSADLVRRLVERGAEVQVVMTSGAQRFVTPLTFQALSGRPVRSDLWDESAEAAMGHIELARWATHVLVAPASADFIAAARPRPRERPARDALPRDRCAGRRGPGHEPPDVGEPGDPGQRRHPARPRRSDSRPGEGGQACGETGPGRMLEPAEIVAALWPACQAGGAGAAGASGVPAGTLAGALAGRKVLITAGPTRERIDPVRFITNRSSGKMGYAVAEAARAAGAEVVIVSGPVNLPAPAGARRVDAETAEQMMDAVRAELADTDIFIAAAAVSITGRCRPRPRRSRRPANRWCSRLSRTTDILATVAAGKPRPFVVGFAAETQNVERNALAKLQGKRLDMIAPTRWATGSRSTARTTRSPSTGPAAGTSSRAHRSARSRRDWCA